MVLTSNLHTASKAGLLLQIAGVDMHFRGCAIITEGDPFPQALYTSTIQSLSHWETGGKNLASRIRLFDPNKHDLNLSELVSPRQVETQCPSSIQGVPVMLPRMSRVRVERKYNYFF